MEHLFPTLTRHPKRIVFTDGHDPRVIQAAAAFAQRRLGVCLLIGKPENILPQAASLSLDLRHIKIIDPTSPHFADELDQFVRLMQSLPRFKNNDPQELRQLASQPNYFAALMLQLGQADALAGGLCSTSGSLLRPLFHIIKPRPGYKFVSSATIIQSPNTPIAHNGLLFFADTAVIPKPTVEQLAHIAIETARLARQITGQPPRIAMLSYSTKGSAQNEDIDRIIAATALARQHLITQQFPAEIDGELQADAALVPEVAAIKAPNSPVAGKANVLIFPDLNSGNIALKLVQHLARAKAYGQILLGLDRPAAELSRGASVDEILHVAAIIALQAIDYHKIYPDQIATTRYDSSHSP
ncbi:MAG: phosphate acyltransferase [Methylacidiphilales bacterium]|nr:phosphate acyltransferase [Candidatus Methylacidiphilales bacterium]MDW8349751.1 phosphate acyltransferase [Verrucomicrobiae bacterium]